MEKILKFLDDLKLYALIVGINISKYIPTFVLKSFMEVVSFFWFLTDTKRRKATLNNLKHIFGRSNYKIAYLTFRNYMLNFVETLKVKHTSCDEILNKLKIDNLNLLKSTMNRYGKCIMLTAHIGNWEMGASVPGCLGYRCYAIVEHIDDRWLKVLNDVRSHTGVRTYTTENFMKALKSFLKEGGIFITAMDRYVGGRYVWKDFFNSRRKFPVGIFLLNERLKLPMVFAYVIRNGRNYQGIVQDIFEGPYNLEGMLNFYIKNLQKAILKFPDQWFSFDFNWYEEYEEQSKQNIHE